MAREQVTEILAEMVANVMSVAVSPGDAVAAGDTVVLLESMKMEIPVLIEVPGTVRAVKVAPGVLVQSAVERVIGSIQADPDTRNGDITKIIAVVQRQFLPYTDFERTTRLAVGKAWRDATPKPTTGIAKPM